MEINGAKVPIVLKNIFFCVQQKKETHKGLKQLEGENFHFWVYPTFQLNCMKNESTAIIEQSKNEVLTFAQALGLVQ